MVRSAATVLAFLILPGIALAQQTQGTHTVVDGDTLWDLAQSYYGDPFDWRRIWDANRAQIDDPNLILPGQVIIIPDTEAPPPMPPAEEPEEMAPAPAPAESGEMRTIFYTDTTGTMAAVVAAGSREYRAVPLDLVYQAPRITGMVGDPPHTGIVDGAAGGRNPTGTLRTFDRIHVTTDVPARVGDQLQLFRVGKTIEDVGRVVRPTGVVTVSTLVDDGFVGVITKEFARIQPGNFVGPLPSYPLVEGQYAQPVSGGEAAMVMGFSGPTSAPMVGDIAFLDMGSAAGLAIGDEFTLYNTIDAADTEGRLQVIGVQDAMAAARIINMTDAVFGTGVVVRLTKKMR